MDKDIEKLIDSALEEDIGGGDITSKFLFRDNFPVDAELTAKEPGVVCGLGIFREVFLRLSPDFEFKVFAEDGHKADAGYKVLQMRGPVRETMAGERTALNFIQRLSGIATLTAEFAGRAGGIEVYDTRKTAPLLRKLEKYAVKTGGGRNHRAGLFDMVLIKDNHLAAFMQAQGIAGRAQAVGQAVSMAKAGIKKGCLVEVEVECFLEAKEGFLAGADIIMFDNAGREELERFEEFLGERRKEVIIEWSGNVCLENMEKISALPVDRVSVGAITHSAKAMDFSLKILPFHDGDGKEGGG